MIKGTLRKQKKGVIHFKRYQGLYDSLDLRPVYSLNGQEIGSEKIIEMGLPLPKIPDVEEWTHYILRKIRCRYCYRAVRGYSDLKRHNFFIHAKGEQS